MSSFNKITTVLQISFLVSWITKIIFTPDLPEIQKAVLLALILLTSHSAYTRLYNKEESL